MKNTTTIESVALTLFCSGDNRMLTKSYKVLVPELYLVAYSFVKSETIAEDIVADCFKILLQLPNDKRRQKVNEYNFNLKNILLEILKNQSLEVVNSKKN